MHEKKLFSVLIGFVILISLVAAYLIFTRAASAPGKKQGSQSISVSGTIVCLPKPGNGPHTMECMIGLKGPDNKHYGLKNLSKHDPENKFSKVDLHVEATGNFTSGQVPGPGNSQYDTVGTLDITSIKESK